MPFVTAEARTKTLWQKVYSFFGFWTYTRHTPQNTFFVIYWIALPWFKYFRKFDLIEIKLK